MSSACVRILAAGAGGNGDAIPITANLLLRALPEDPQASGRTFRFASGFGHEHDADEKNAVYFRATCDLDPQSSGRQRIEVAMTGPRCSRLNTMPRRTNPTSVLFGSWISACIKAQDIAVISNRPGDVMSDAAKYHTALSKLRSSRSAIAARLSKKLAHGLSLHDRVGADELSLTQAFLSSMLATRRATSRSDQSLESGCSSYRKRVTTSTAPSGNASCGCYAENRRVRRFRFSYADSGGSLDR